MTPESKAASEAGKPVLSVLRLHRHCRKINVSGIPGGALVRTRLGDADWRR